MKDSNLRRLCRRIYSPLPLAARANPPWWCPQSAQDGGPLPVGGWTGRKRINRMGDSSFDVVSKVDRQEVDNALNQAAKELAQRFNFRGTNVFIA